MRRGTGDFYYYDHKVSPSSLCLITLPCSLSVLLSLPPPPSLSPSPPSKRPVSLQHGWGIGFGELSVCLVVLKSVSPEPRVLPGELSFGPGTETQKFRQRPLYQGRRFRGGVRGPGTTLCPGCTLTARRPLVRRSLSSAWT